MLQDTALGLPTETQISVPVSHLAFDRRTITVLYSSNSDRFRVNYLTCTD